MKPKIYLSKSKAGNFDDIVKVKTHLGKYDCEILEFQGGVYSTDKLLASEVLIILPPICKEAYGDYTGDFYIGKGQYSELELFSKKYPSSPIIIIANAEEAFDLRTFTDNPVEDPNCQQNWQNCWGFVDGNSLKVKLREYLGLIKKDIKPEEFIIKTISKEKEESSVTIKTNLNLLICC